MAIIYRIKRFSSSILNTRITGIGFQNKRKYDQDMDRLQKGDTLRELNSPNVYNKEIAKLKKELNDLLHER
jgi:hypothetical protein